MRGRVFHLRRQPPPRQGGRQLLAMVGALLLHVLFLFGFVLGAAFQPALPSPRSDQALQVRLIELPEPPPPPPVRGTPPKERGKRHQGHPRLASVHPERSANTAAVTAKAPAPAPAPRVIAAAPQAPARQPKPVVAPPLAAALPPVLLPLPKPVKPAGEPPVLAVPIATPLPPAPPPLQPEPVRPPQVEGNRPILPPASLALPTAAVPVPANLPVMAMHMEVPQTVAAVSVTPAPQPALAPDLPRLQPLSLPAQPTPIVTLQPPLLTPALTASPAVAEPVAASPVSEPPVALATAASASTLPSPMPLSKLDLNPPPRTLTAPAPRLLPAAEASIAVANVTPLTPAPSPIGPSVSPAAAASVESPTLAAQARAPDTAVDVSRAPDATAQGSDTAAPGELAGAASAPSAAMPTGTDASRPLVGTGKPDGLRGKSLAAGRPGGDQPGAIQGAPQGALGHYVQLQPTGDTEIMRHRTPDIGYQPTRFDKNWTPADESSVDTALRHAVEKTTIKRTFHLPRGVRIECAVKPLLPIALFGCRNPDPPAVPVAEKVYEPMHLAPADPLVTPSTVATDPAASASTPTPMIKVDNGAECAVARLSGGPPPPGCATDAQTVQAVHVPASSASSWVPASDQFH
ncbi:MAG: hypothetical protein ABI389_12490 [Rhodanobacter sp.]